jgi:hypothetical protein
MWGVTSPRLSFNMLVVIKKIGEYMRKLFIILLIGMLIVSCTDATLASFGAYGESHHIRMFNGGILVAEWYSTGKVATMDSSDGWEFMDKATGRLVRVGGDVIIEVAK